MRQKLVVWCLRVLLPGVTVKTDWSSTVVHYSGKGILLDAKLFPRLRNVQ